MDVGAIEVIEYYILLHAFITAIKQVCGSLTLGFKLRVAPRNKGEQNGHDDRSLDSLTKQNEQRYRIEIVGGAHRVRCAAISNWL